MKRASSGSWEKEKADVVLIGDAPPSACLRISAIFSPPPLSDPPSTHTLALGNRGKSGLLPLRTFFCLFCTALAWQQRGLCAGVPKLSIPPLPNGRYFFGFSFCAGGKRWTKGGIYQDNGILLFFPLSFLIHIFWCGAGAVVHLSDVHVPCTCTQLDGSDARLVASHSKCRCTAFGFHSHNKSGQHNGTQNEMRQILVSLLIETIVPCIVKSGERALPQ